LVVVLDNGATSTDIVTVDIGNPVQVPTIFVSQSSLNLGNTSQGVAGATKSYTVGGTYLTGDIDIDAPLTVELSISGAAETWTPTLLLPQSGGSVPQTTIFARIAASHSSGAVSGMITRTSTGATGKNRFLAVSCGFGWGELLSELIEDFSKRRADQVHHGLERRRIPVDSGPCSCRLKRAVHAFQPRVAVR